MTNNSFTNIFTGNPVWAANVSYASYSLTGNISLDWPTQFLDNPNTIGNWTSISVNNNGYIVTLPTAEDASVGTSIVFINSSGSNFSYIVHDNAGNALATITQGKAVSLLLTNNSTAAGSWTVFPFAQGTTAVTSVAATTPSVGLTIGGSPITSAGTLTFTLASQLSTLAGLNSTGIMVQTSTGPSVMASRSLVGGINIDVTNADGILGNPTIDLSDTLAGLSSVVVGSLTLSNNTIQTTAGNINIQIEPNGTGSILLGAGLTPPTVTSTGNITNVGSLSATTVNAGNLQLSSNILTTSTVNGNVNVNGNGTGSAVLQSASSLPFSINSGGIAHHPSIVSAWAYFNGATAAITKNYNTITSITRNSTGNYTVVLGVSFVGDYLILPSAFDAGVVGIVVNVTAQSASQFTLNAKNLAGVQVDPSFVWFATIGLI